MKKLFAMAALVTFFTACNNGSEEKKVEVTKDSANSESPLMDAVNTQDSVTKKIEDSTHKLVDSTMK
jgi:hypothetical protein